MEWFAENATNGYAFLAFAAFMLAGIWWIQKQILYLVGAGVALVALLVFWLVIRNVPTTAGRIEADLQALAKALLAGDKPKAEEYVADDFKYRAKTRDKWYAFLEELIADHHVDALEISKFELKKHSRADNEASVAFHLDARSKGKSVYKADCPWKMSRADETWQVQKVTLRGTDRKGKKDEDE